MAQMLLAFIITTAISQWVHGSHPSTTPAKQIIWYGFLFGLPVFLAGFLLTGARWTLMAGVMYGTIGLALDISTIVQELTRSQDQPTMVVFSGITGLLNFLLIAIGGRGFLDVVSHPTPPAGRPPNPPFRFGG